MGWDQIKKFYHSNIRNLFRSNESQFALYTSLKILSVPLLCSIFVGFILWTFIKMNQIFFEANGYPEVAELREAYVDYIFGDLAPNLFWVILGLTGIFFAGNFMASLLLRPFKMIGEYTQTILEGKEDTFNPDIFSDLKLLTMFSEYFFHHIELSLTQSKLLPIKIPKHYSRVHKPVFEKVFFFHFCLFLLIVGIGSAVTLYVVSVEVHQKLVQLSLDSLEHRSTVSYFLQSQGELLETSLLFSISFLVLLYALLAFHIYNQVSGAAFGVFSTMRSFLKGNMSARVHLIGYNHVRESCRQINKYLDHIQGCLDTSGKTGTKGRTPTKSKAS